MILGTRAACFRKGPTHSEAHGPPRTAVPEGPGEPQDSRDLPGPMEDGCGHFLNLWNFMALQRAAALARRNAQGSQGKHCLVASGAPPPKGPKRIAKDKQWGGELEVII